MEDQPTPIAEDDSKPSFAAVVTEGADAPPSAAGGDEASAAGGDPAAEPAEGAAKDYGAVKQAEGAAAGDAPIDPQVRGSRHTWVEPPDRVHASWQ
jgi:hypothetical protein